MNIITEQDLFQIFLNQNKKSAKFISLKTRKTEETKKKSRTTMKTLLETFGTDSITKESELTVQLNANYENSVNNRLEKAGEERDFVAEKLPYGEYVEGSKCLIKHDGKIYVRVYQTNSKLGKTARYFKSNGEELSKEHVEILQRDFLKVRPEFIESQGLSYEESSKPTNYKLENIKGIKIDGEEYSIS